MHIRSAVLDLTQSPFQSSTLSVMEQPMGYYGKVQLSFVWWLPQGKNYHDIPSVALHDAFTFSDPAYFLSYANTEIIKSPWEMPLICSNHFSLEFQGVITQFHILKHGRLKEYLAQNGSGIPRTSYLAKAIGDLVSNLPLSVVGFALNSWKHKKPEAP